jgi:uncharacterized pyridoxal phosphate-containing UPF0001 family protein
MAVVRAEFALIRDLQRRIQAQRPDIPFAELSLGMSNDYQAAIEAGSTMLRLGSVIFGERVVITEIITHN